MCVVVPLVLPLPPCPSQLGAALATVAAAFATIPFLFIFACATTAETTTAAATRTTLRTSHFPGADCSTALMSA